MPVPIPVDVSPVSDGSAEKDWETAASGGMLKVSQWRQTILSFRSVDRRNAFLAAAHVVQSLAMGEEETGAKPSWLSNSAGAQKGMSMVAQHTGDVLHETCHCGPEASMSDEEEEDWELHRKKTGLVAKLVTYDSRERMLRDFKLRPGVRRSGIVVWGVAPRGPCARAGVQPGDRLVSINGRQDIIHLMASECKVPATLIFMGTAGRITTEVRLISSEAALSDKGFTLLSDKVLGGARTKYLYQEEKLCPVLHRHGCVVVFHFDLQFFDDGLYVIHLIVVKWSKSAKRRAAKKARDAAHPAEAAPTAPETTPEKPKAKAAAKAPAAEPKAKPKEAAKAAAKPKAAPKEEPKKPDPKAAAKSKAKAAPEAAKPKEAPKAKADPKAKAGAAKAKAKAEPAPPPPAPEPAPKAKGKAKAAPEPKSSPPKAAAKSKAGAPQKKEEDTAAPERVEVVQPFEVDDGTGGEWEQSTGLSKKAEKRKEKQEMMKKEACQQM
ncbi:Zinc metalloprotease ZmpB [Durusdinium trenchii]|uniref:Zinc metalloprotease ZmpB n=1 Tax=Durusdinium trenchii TaxID=1381693 RepID=A0ABP0L2V8_9DINO